MPDDKRYASEDEAWLAYWRVFGTAPPMLPDPGRWDLLVQAWTVAIERGVRCTREDLERVRDPMAESVLWHEYYEKFGQAPPRTPSLGEEKLLVLWREAIERGTPLTMEDMLRDDPETLAKWKAGRVILWSPTFSRA